MGRDERASRSAGEGAEVRWRGAESVDQEERGLRGPATAA